MRFVLRRLGFFALTLWVALTLNFLLPRMMPGDPALAIIASHKGGVSPQALKALDAEFGLNRHQSMASQYAQYLRDVSTGHFGVSLTTFPGASVARVVLDAIPWTLGLVGDHDGARLHTRHRDRHPRGAGAAAAGWTASCRRSS